MVEIRKQAVSIRMNAADVSNVKRIAKRLGARDSDVIRFAVKLMLGRLAPLCDPNLKGRSLLPVFVESGAELLRFFDLDGSRLEAIINESVEPLGSVDRDDIALLALSGSTNRYAELRLSSIQHMERVTSEKSEPSALLRQYLYDKYVYRGLGEPDASGLASLHAPGASAPGASE
jgi:hypothetical protein